MAMLFGSWSWMLRAGVVGLAVAGTAPLMPHASAQAPAIQTQEFNNGLVGEITEAKRKEGVLTIRLRLRNPGDKDQGVTFGARADHDKFYVTAANKKYLPLRDSDGTTVAASDYTQTVRKGGTYIWWVKYPAPPADQKKFNFITPFGPPFEDVPISD